MGLRLTKQYARPASQVVVRRSRLSDSLDWMGRDVVLRLLPFTAVVVAVWALLRPRWLGVSAGALSIQLAAGVCGAVLLFFGGASVQLWLSRRRRALRVPGSGADLWVQAAYYVLLNAPLEEAVFRGLLQGAVTALAGPALGLAVGTAAYVLYHRLGGWAWQDVAATALVGVPLALLYWLLPGQPSLVAVSLAHAGATCGFLGPGPWLLWRLRLLA
ncbi:MAG: CPBP family intramembrane metalloprotease [Candidatus Dormibacteraeota bacterium]|nr:CPBP family intramembrane metalloprotease [Candidatus Dormibacteraeota bacterium]